LDLKNKENEINHREIFLLEKSIKIYEEIEKEAQKIAESRFEKLCAEKDQIIKGKEKKIKDLNSEINQIYSKFGSYLKIKR
jgi:vacuolar-type H+-ATPase subunit H